MPSIIQLPTHIANLIAAGEVVERPASVVKELLENAVDAGAAKITVEIRDGGMTFLRVTDDGCGMSPQDARTAFLRHATSKLRTAEDLAAIASVSRIDLMTKQKGSLSGTSLHLEAGVITEETETGCPEGTTIIIRDLFFNTPARMKFMKSDTVEAGRVTAAVQLQALAHPQVAIQFLRDGKQVLSTPGGGSLQAAVYCVYGREFAAMAQVQSKWDDYRLSGYVSKPTQARPSRNLQTFFVNNRPVKSRLLVSAFEEAYRNQLMVGKFPACVLHLELPATAVDVNVHPAKTEVKFLNEKAVFDCVHYGVLAALNKTADRPAVQFPQSAPAPQTAGSPKPAAQQPTPTKSAPRQDFYRTMTPEEFKTFSAALEAAPRPKQDAAAAAAALVQKAAKEQPVLCSPVTAPKTPPAKPEMPKQEPLPPLPEFPPEPSKTAPLPKAPEPQSAPKQEPEPVQEELPLPAGQDWRMVGELYRSYILVEQGEDAFLIDKHAAHERILFEKLKSNQEAISGQQLLSPIPVRLNPAAAAELLANRDMLEELGFEIEEFGENTLLLRQIPMDLSPEDAAQAVESLAADLLNGRREHKDTVRDELLHTVACKAAIKAGWVSDEQELLAIAREVMAREDLKYCPHGRPICVSLSKKQLEKQFKRT